jgi:hypothetical protein
MDISTGVVKVMLAESGSDWGSNWLHPSTFTASCLIQS